MTERRERAQVKCPGCGNETNVAVAKEEHIYAELFLGLPTFWRFMSPTVARSITAMILAICFALIWLAVGWLNRGEWLIGLLACVPGLFSLYILMACVRSLGKHQLKQFYKCNDCGLEWSWFKENGQR